MFIASAALQHSRANHDHEARRGAYVRYADAQLNIIMLVQQFVTGLNALLRREEAHNGVSQ